MALKSGHGTVVGGFYGATMWRWLMIDGLWIDASLRGQGLGKNSFSQRSPKPSPEAITRGCLGSWLGTFDFQARDFYEHLDHTSFFPHSPASRPVTRISI
jgi:hypothetical protein